MNLVLFLDVLDVAGAQCQFATLACGLARRGHSVTFVTLWPGGVHWDRLGAQQTIVLRSLYRHRGASMPQRLAQYAGAPRRLAGILRERRADVLYGALHSINLLARLATLMARNVPVVWSVRSAGQAIPWKQQPGFQLCRLLSRSVPLIVSNSRAGLVHHRSLGFRPGADCVIPNGVDVATFRPDQPERHRIRAEWGVQPQHCLIGVVARLVPVKNHAAFLRAAAMLADRSPDVRFVCVGDGSAGFRAQLQQQAHALALDDRLLWAGERHDMAAVYNALDVACLSSVAEGMPNAVAEAMASAVPCVVTDVGDATELVADTGIVVPSDDAPALAEALWTLVEQDVHVRRSLGGRARDRIVERFSVEAMVTATEQAFERVVGQRNEVLHAAGRGRPRPAP